ncbi:MAG TPA: alpha-L-rhamnosidase [Lachnospiraceae bacterium]|nr:alpha-L-rhamnosidase [Lachnospiraceae bacterium]
MSTAYWIWYPGDFELYHAMKQNFSRIERGCGWPAFWKSEGFRNRVVFRKEYGLEKETAFCVYSKAVGYVLAGDRKYPFGERIVCGPGQIRISVHAACIETFPSVYIKGNVIYSDKTWQAEDYGAAPVMAGYSNHFTREEQNPSVWIYREKIYLPVSAEVCGDGILYGFETELTAVLEITYKKGYRPLRVYCGESREEALDREHCYYSWEPEPDTGRCPRCAVRYAYIPDCGEEEVEIKAVHQYVDIPVRARFVSSDKLINRIWSVAEHTFSLCSGIFFIDGIKRDKWIWGGDAYQSFFVNQYLMADADINRRTLLALRGNDPMTTHINTILDYTLYWILSIKIHHEAYNDLEFLEQVFPKMCSLMEFCESQLDGHGFIVGRKGDWIFIDWADLDKEGALCAEQMLFAECYKTMAVLGRCLGKETAVYTAYEKKYELLKNNINAFYWNSEKGAYIDSFSSGKNHVTRHGNIFAILFQIADKEKQEQIVENVLHNDAVPQITTPYFKFFEMDALCKMGYLEEVLIRIRQYWGGMLERGAVTFWEEYDPDVPEAEQYDMYGDKFGKSLCHAWSASPIYLLARYFVGLEITDPVKGGYELHPHLEYFDSLDCILPVGDKNIHVVWDGKELTEYTLC